MTRLCMDCGADLGEKCLRCGSTQVFNARDLQCRNCGLEFTRGQGGETHGICPPCMEKRMVPLQAEAKRRGIELH